MSNGEFTNILLSNTEHLKPFAITLTKNAETAGDLIQETFYRAYVNKEKYNSGTNMKAWLYTIMRNIFINDYRRNVKQRYQVEKQFQPTTTHVLNTAGTELQVKEIQKAITKLPDIFKQPFVLFYNGYKYNEIAEVLNEPLGTIKSRIHFARKFLKTHIINQEKN